MVRRQQAEYANKVVSLLLKLTSTSWKNRIKTNITREKDIEQESGRIRELNKEDLEGRTHIIYQKPKTLQLIHISKVGPSALHQ